MRATVRVYWRILVAGFRRQSAYLLAAFGGLVANTTFGLLKVAILFATVRAAGGELALGGGGIAGTPLVAGAGGLAGPHYLCRSLGVACG